MNETSTTTCAASEDVNWDNWAGPTQEDLDKAKQAFLDAGVSLAWITPRNDKAWQHCKNLDEWPSPKQITDEQRLDFMSKIPTCNITKKYSSARGSHWPWVIKIVNRKESPEFDDIRDAIDWCIKKNM